MAASPIVQVKDGSGSWVSATGGVNVAPGNTISIRLLNTLDVSQWILRVFGVDEVTTTAPSLTGVDPLTNIVSTPSTVVTFTMPLGTGIGRAVLFRSTVNEGGAGLQATFGTYVLTSAGFRVGATGERFEGDPAFGWAVTVNAVIRAAGTGGGIPPLVGEQFAALYEDPVGALKFGRLTEDMILPGLGITTFSKTAPNTSQVVYRRGATVTGITASASYISGPPTSAAIVNTLGGSSDAGDIAPGVWTINGPDYITASMAGSVKRSGTDIGEDPTMIATLTAGGLNPQTKTLTLTWTSDVWFGVGAAGFNTQAQIKALGGTELSPLKGRTFVVSPTDQKVYYSAPQAYGLVTFTVNGLPAPFTHSVVSLTNVNGVIRNYSLYESVNYLTGTNVTFVAV